MKRESRLFGLLALGAAALLSISTSATRAQTQTQEKPDQNAGNQGNQENQEYLLNYAQALFRPTNLAVAGNDANIADLARVHADGSFNCATCHGGGQEGAGAGDGTTAQYLLTQNTAQNSFPYWIMAHRDPADTALGATLEPVDEGLRAQLGLETKTGLVVSALADSGPAANAGLKQNDILLSLADVTLVEAADLPKQLKAAGEKEVPLKLFRRGKPLTLRVRPIARMTLAPAAPEKVDYYIGVSASPPDEVLRAHVLLPDGQGLLVTEVVPKSPAEKSGVKKFDILLKLDDKPLDRTETLSAQVQAISDKAVTLTLYRGGKPVALSIKPEPRQSTTSTTMHDAVRLWSVKDPTAKTFAYTLDNKLNATQPGNPPWAQTFTFTYPHGVRPFFNEPAAKPNAVTPANTTQADPTAQRLDKLDKQIQAIQKALDELKDALKKSR